MTDVTTPASTAPATAVDTTIAADDVRTARVSVADYDGAGGVCVEIVSDGGVEAAGCLPGPAVTAGRGAYFAGPGANAVVRVDAGGTTATFVEEPNACFDPIAVVGEPLKDVVACTSTGDVLYAPLSADPAATTAYTTTFLDNGVLREAPSAVAGVAVFVAAPAGGGYQCLVVVAAGAPGWREGCVASGPPAEVLAGSPAAPVIVSLADGVPSVVALDPDPGLLASGCRAATGALLAGLPTNAVMTGVRCVDGAAVGRFGAVRHQPAPMPDGGLTLQRGAGDGTWPAGDTDVSLGCARYAQTCAEFGAVADLGEAVLPIPAAEVVTTAFPETILPPSLPPRDETARYREIVGIVADTTGIFDALLADNVETGIPETQFEITYLGDRAPMLVRVTRLGDDAGAALSLALWYGPAEGGGIEIDAAVLVVSCARGLTESDGETLCT